MIKDNIFRTFFKVNKIDVSEIINKDTSCRILVVLEIKMNCM